MSNDTEGNERITVNVESIYPELEIILRKVIELTLQEVKRLAEEQTNAETLTCVYCGMAYPEGTPPHGAKVLTDHIKVCKKHPMREAEATISKLRDALSGLIGASTKEELTAMEMALRTTSAPEADKIAAINAIHALLEADIDTKI